MKNFISILFLLFPFFLAAQTCEEKIAIAKKNAKKGDYRLALKQFNAAAADCGAAKSSEIEKHILEIYEKIEGLKNEALSAKARAEAAEKNALSEKEKALMAEAETKRALQKADKLIKAFYFYADRFALAYGASDNPYAGNKFYFIDKNGDRVKKLGEYDKAEQFDILGYAKTKDKDVEYLLDTFGIKYRVAYALSDLNPAVEALDLRASSIDSFPNEIFRNPQLKILIVNGSKNPNFVIPETINLLTQLQSLHLDFCGIGTLPKQLFELSNLQTLTLKGNNLKTLPESIKDLPNLKKLDISSNNIQKFPEQIGSLAKLVDLNASYNKLQNLPAEIGALAALRILNVKHNRLQNIPIQINRLGNLALLDVSWNLLQKLPFQSGSFKNQIEIDSSYNQLYSFSERRKTLIKNYADVNLTIYDDAYLLYHDLITSTDTTYILYFWATWCKPCVDQLPYFEELNQKCGNSKIKVLLVSLDFKSQIEKRLIPYLKSKKLSSRILLLADQNADSWIPAIYEYWDGAIPFSAIWNENLGQRYKLGAFDSFNELEQWVQPWLQWSNQKK